jgi:ubiquitin C-terminal hydrolase
MKGDKIKVHTSLPFPQELDLQDYIKNDEVLETKYNLKGVVIHTGTSEGGHYYSLIRDNGPQKKWLKFNDQNVLPFD